MVPFFEVMIDGSDSDVWTNENPIFDFNDASRQKGGAFIDRDVFP